MNSPDPEQPKRSILLTLYVAPEDRVECLERLEAAVNGHPDARIVVVDVRMFPEIAKIEDLIMVPTIIRLETREDGTLKKSIMVGKLTDRVALMKFVSWGPEIVIGGFRKPGGNNDFDNDD